MRVTDFLLFSLIAMLLVSCSSEDSYEARLADSDYIDPKGFFSFTAPHDWDVQEYPNDPRGKAAFFGPDNVELRVLTSSVDDSSVEGLISHAKAMEDKLGINTNIVKINFNGIPAIERSFNYGGDRLRYIDFSIKGITHNLSYAAPKNRYQEFIGISKLSFATYEPIHRKLSEKEKNDNHLAKMYRLGTLYNEQGKYNAALEYVDLGLQTVPSDPRLLALKKKIAKNIIPTNKK